MTPHPFGNTQQGGRNEDGRERARSARSSRWRRSSPPPSRRGSAARGARQTPIVIGWAFDSKGNMAPFDDPALAAAQGPRQADQRQGRRQRRPLKIDHLRHAEQQAGEGEVVRREPARQGRGHHLHDLRRRLRDAGRPGVASTRACSRSRRASAPIRWARSASARRARSRSASATSRRTRARPWRSTPRTKGWKTASTRHEHPARLLQERRAGVRGRASSSSAARSSAGDLRDRAEQRQQRRQPAERRQGRRVRDLDRVRRAARVRLRHAHRSATTRRSSTRGPATAPTGAEEPAGLELLRRDLRLRVRRRPEPGGQQLAKKLQGRHRRLRHRRRRDRRRRRPRSSAPAARRTARRWRRRW